MNELDDLLDHSRPVGGFMHWAPTIKGDDPVGLVLSDTVPDTPDDVVRLGDVFRRSMEVLCARTAETAESVRMLSEHLRSQGCPEAGQPDTAVSLVRTRTVPDSGPRHVPLPRTGHGTAV